MRRLSALSLVSLVVCLATLTGNPAQAEDAVRDEIILTLQEEAWVDATDARLVLSIETAVSADRMAETRQRIAATLDDIDPSASWRTTQFNRFPDPTGLERWRVVAEARVAETTVGDVRGRTEAASEAGYKVTVQVIDFSPGPSAYEAARAELRQKLYAAAKAERDRLNAVFTERGFRLAEIDFVGRMMARGAGDARMAKAMAPQIVSGRAESAQFMAADTGVVGGGAGGAAMAVSRRLVMNATVVLSAD
ncbi:MAG: hypothetical protein NXI16_00180 [Alphaproteobacteria bacterium]|nr:hypothetical protein [Alphaproteobacteria bacterium]